MHYQKTAITEIVNGGSIELNMCPDNSSEEDPLVFIESESESKPEEGRHHFSMTRSQYSKHILLIGGIGSGKTNTFNHIIRQTINRLEDNDVAFIFDTKGDFKNTFYQGKDENHYLIGNGPAYRDITSYWNIYKELTFEQGYVQEDSDLAAKEIASQLFKGTGGQGNEFFETTAADLFAIKLIDTLRRGHMWEGQSQDKKKAALRVRKEEWNNEALLAFFSGPFMTEYPAIIARNDDFGFAKGYLGLSDDQAGNALDGQTLGILAQLGTVVNNLFIGIFGKRDPHGQGISMRKQVRDKCGQVVFIEYDISIGEKLGPVYRTLIDLALKEALGQSEEHKGNIYFFIDEFKLLPNLRHIDDALNFGRSLGVKIVAGIQNVHQIYDIYQTERGKALFAGFMNCFAFSTPDAETRAYVSQRLGPNYNSTHFHIGGEPQIVQREGRVVEEWHLLNLKIGQACVDIVGVPPFMFRFEDYEQKYGKR